MEKQLNIGCSGFYNRHWKGIFYPEKLPQNQWLNYYCEHFPTLELNTTFYRFPTVKSFETWYGKSPVGFLFSVKVPKIITHLKKFNDCESLIKDFYTAAEQGLKDKLGCILFQLPPSIHYSEERLQQIISSLDLNFKNVIEFRHISWWKQEVYDALAASNITFCSVSHPSLPETIIQATQIDYIRLHGTPQMFYSNYDHNYLQQLYRTINESEKPQQAFVYFNNTAGNAGILNAMELQAMNK